MIFQTLITTTLIFLNTFVKIVNGDDIVEENHTSSTDSSSSNDHLSTTPSTMDYYHLSSRNAYVEDLAKKRELELHEFQWKAECKRRADNCKVDIRESISFYNRYFIEASPMDDDAISETQCNKTICEEYEKERKIFADNPRKLVDDILFDIYGWNVTFFKGKFVPVTNISRGLDLKSNREVQNATDFTSNPELQNKTDLKSNPEARNSTSKMITIIKNLPRVSKLIWFFRTIESIPDDQLHPWLIDWKHIVAYFEHSYRIPFCNLAQIIVGATQNLNENARKITKRRQKGNESAIVRDIVPFTHCIECLVHNTKIEYVDPATVFENYTKTQPQSDKTRAQNVTPVLLSVMKNKMSAYSSLYNYIERYRRFPGNAL